MLENSVDLSNFDILWQNKPELPVANDENKKLEELLKQKKIEVARLKITLENNTNKGKLIQEHLNEVRQELDYKQQLYKTKEHEMEMEIHSEKLLSLECSRLEQEIKAYNHEINSLKNRHNQREVAIADQIIKRNNLKSSIQWDEEKLLQYLEKSVEMEKNNMALLKYTNEDDSKINELELMVERLSKEACEKKTALEDINTEVLIVQTELDRIQEEFREAYNDRNILINNWEKVINQIQQINKEIKNLSKLIEKLREEQTTLNLTLKEQKELLSRETIRNDKIEFDIKEKDNIASRLRNDYKSALEREEDLKTQLSIMRNILNNLLYQKSAAENNLKQLEKQLNNRAEKILNLKETNKKLETDIETLTKETFDASHYTKELDDLFRRENAKNQNLENEIANICKDIINYSQEINKLKAQEKFIDSEIKNKQTEIKNLNAKLLTLDQVRAKQESELYSTESNLEKLQLRLKRMIGETNEEERRQIELQRSTLLNILEEKKKSLNMLTEELKIMSEKMNVVTKELESNKKKNFELQEKLKFLELYILNSQKSLKCCVTRKQEILVQECLEKFQMKRYQKLLNNKNKSVFSLQKNKLELETMMKERVEELKHCNELLDIERRTEEEECSIVKRKYQESLDKASKYQTKYKVILDALGITQSDENAEAEILIKAENEKRDLQHNRNTLITSFLKNDDELCALKNTIWVINAAIDQFRQAIYPPGTTPEDGEELKKAQIEAQELAIQIHTKKSEIKHLEESVQSKKEKLVEEQKQCNELQPIVKDKESENEMISKELSDLQIKIQRAERCNSRLSLEVKNQSTQIGIEEDIKIHLLREIKRTVSDLLFTAVGNMPDVQIRIRKLYEEANLGLPSRAYTLFSRSNSTITMSSRQASVGSPLSSARSSRSGMRSPSIVTLGSLDGVGSF